MKVCLENYVSHLKTSMDFKINKDKRFVAWYLVLVMAILNDYTSRMKTCCSF